MVGWANPKVWIVCYLPQMTIRVFEVATVSTPKHLLRLLHQCGSGLKSSIHDLIRFRFGTNVVSKRE